MAKMSEPSFGWALLTTSCLGLAVIATVATPHPSSPRAPLSTRHSQPSPTLPSPTAHSVRHGAAQPAVNLQPTPHVEARTIALGSHRTTVNQQDHQTLPTTTTTIPTSSQVTSTTTTTEPVVQMAAVTPHSVGYVAQPLAALASYDLSAESGGEVTVRNESTMALLITVDRGKASSLDASTSLVVKLSLGLHQLEISASSTSPQSYVIDGTLVSW
ncbi:MAG: hypothetical protein WCK25_05500 [Actinomycetes bacterium]